MLELRRQTMSSVKGKIVRLFSGVALKRAAVVSVQAFGGFQRLRLRSDAQGFSAGAKVQLLLPSDDMRTYTPISSPDGMVLLGWMHAGGPGARWMSNARPGDELPFVGPQRSLSLDAGPVVLVGDETSVAVAAAFAAERPGQVHAVIQSEAASDVRAAAESVGLRQVDVVARGDTAATVDAVKARLSTSPDAVVALTGGSELVVGVRDALRRAGVRNIKTKTYWTPGRAGLD
ncbi:siderophore-interacting protein [Sorangium sp. So ce1078]|uniref:siderophore-interacting protein n=1 Tax=Sorangium sp. So ce1078 TaxID=3133329 RepID=UPI003F5DF9B7